MPTQLAVAVGGALGALTRYLVDRSIEARASGVFPWSTFTINLSGCFVVGVVVAALVDRHHAPQWVRLGLVMGVLGGYTTFSTFGQETLDLIEEGRLAVAMSYAVASVAVGVGAVFAGARIGRVL
jgi:fluoride exporter